MLGYAGMVSFGPAGFYAIGAYTTALILTNTNLPFSIAMIAGPLVTTFISVIIGFFCVRLFHMYFALLTLAFSQIIYTIIFEWYSFTKGDDGIVGIPIPESLLDLKTYYYFSLIIVSISILLLWKIVSSPFGKTLRALRENPERTEFIGINLRAYRLGAFVLSSFFLGVSGSLYCAFKQNVFPVYAHWAKSTDMLVVCLLGGVRSFLGPVVGSVVYIFLDKTVPIYTLYWPLVLGIIITFLVLFLRGGIMGFLREKISERRNLGARE
jgi:branched-chain amino acid transport system permease protein